MLIAGMLNIFFALALNYTNYRWKLHALLARDKGGCRLDVSFLMMRKVEMPSGASCERQRERAEEQEKQRASASGSCAHVQLSQVNQGTWRFNVRSA